MNYEAARVRVNADGHQVAELPVSFETEAEAMHYIDKSPVSTDGNRPWVRDKRKPAIGSFLVIGGTPTHAKKRF